MPDESTNSIMEQLKNACSVEKGYSLTVGCGFIQAFVNVYRGSPVTAAACTEQNSRAMDL